MHDVIERAARAACAEGWGDPDEVDYSGSITAIAVAALQAALDPGDDELRKTLLAAMGFVSTAPGEFSPHAHEQAHAALLDLRSACSESPVPNEAPPSGDDLPIQD